MQQQPKPTTTTHIQQWFDNHLTWEIPHDTIRYNYLNPSSNPYVMWYYNQRVIECCIEIEKRIIFRCLPYYHKHITHQSKLFAVHMYPELWKYFIYILSCSCPPEKKTISKIYIPDHGFRRCEYNERVSWFGNLPKLYNANWNFKKWVDVDTYALWRARVIEMHLIYNTYTHLVRVEFKYETQCWSDNEKKWYFV